MPIFNQWTWTWRKEIITETGALSIAHHSPPKWLTWLTLCKETFSGCLLILMAWKVLEKALLKLPNAMKQYDYRSQDPVEVWCSMRLNKIEAMAYGKEDRAVLLWVLTLILIFYMMLACSTSPSFYCYSVQSGQGMWLINFCITNYKIGRFLRHKTLESF